MKHYWSYCTMCEHDVVICGKCGNNCCSGGYGTIDGVECDACPSAYELYLKGEPSMLDKKKRDIAQLNAWISALIAEERTEKPTMADIITAFTDLIAYIEADEE